MFTHLMLLRPPSTVVLLLVLVNSVTRLLVLKMSHSQLEATLAMEPFPRIVCIFRWIPTLSKSSDVCCFVFSQRSESFFI
jgi:hypothetical protein